MEGGGWINDRKINTNEGEKSGKGRKDTRIKVCAMKSVMMKPRRFYT